MSRLKYFLVLIALSLIGVNASAHLSADKTVINKNTGKAIVSVNFITPVTGDLYLAVSINGQLLFYADSGKTVSIKVVPFLRNANFKDAIQALTVSSEGVPPGVYSLYQVITRPDTDPLDFKNWIGGLAGLSTLNLSINLPESPLVKPQTPTDISTPANDCFLSKVRGMPDEFSEKKEVSEADDAAADEDENIDSKEAEDEVEDKPPVVDNCNTVTSSNIVTTGKIIYRNNCTSCHGSNPLANQNNVMKGRDVTRIRDAIKSNKGGVMGALDDVRDTDLQAVSDYLKSL